MFYERFEKLCMDSGKSVFSVLKDLHITPSTNTSWKKNGNTPNGDTLTKIADYFHVSVDYLLSRDLSASKVLIPVFGIVRAGYPIYAEENIIDYEEISKEMAREGEFYALKIKGDSMTPRFVEGDIVIVKKCETVDNGEIAIVMVGKDEATIKKFYKTAVGVQLVATNPNYPAMTFTPEEVDSLPVTISGKVVELRAKF